MRRFNLVLNTLSFVLFLFIIIWFISHQFSPIDRSVPVTIVIKDGKYQPEFLQVPAGKKLVLRFLREDNNPCAETVLFPQLNSGFDLPLNRVASIELPPQKQGELNFRCSSDAYRGKIIIV